MDASYRILLTRASRERSHDHAFVDLLNKNKSESSLLRPTYSFESLLHLIQWLS